MSLILEALKKSEQQRRLGEAPTLGSPVLSTRPRRSLLPLFGALIVAALGVGWWLLRTPAPVDTPVAAAPAPAAEPAVPPTATNDRAKAPARPAAVNHDLPVPRRDAAAPVVHPATTPPVGDRPGSVAMAPQPGAAAPGATPATRPALQSTPTAAPPHAAAPPAAKPAQPAVAMAASPTTAAPANPPAPTAATAPTPAPTAATPATPPAPAPAPAAAAKPQQPALPSIWELPYSTRKDLPAISLTMHVYASVPAERFVVVKGERHVEGDDLGDGLTLREIRPDGIVLDFKGQRFVFPRDGR